MLQRVQRQLFQVSEVETPSEVCDHVVKRDAWAIEETWVIRADRDSHSVTEQAPHWMGAQVMAVAEQQIARRTALNADIPLFDLFNQVRMHD